MGNQRTNLNGGGLINKIKRLIIGAQNLPDWKPAQVLDIEPTLARYHHIGLSRKKRQYRNESSGYGDYGIPFFKVPLEKCLSASLFNYRPDGGHPFVDAVKYYQSGDTEQAHEVLYRFFRKFTPHTLHDFFFGSTGQTASGNSPELQAKIPSVIHNDTFEDTAFPWSWHPFPGEHDLGGQRQQHRLYFGPESDNGINTEAERLFKLSDKIRKEGEVVDFATPVEGYLLCDEHNDYRFMIRKGKHRVAVLSALGFETVIATFVGGMPRSYDLPLVNSWPKIQNGSWNEEDARAIFKLCIEGRSATFIESNLQG